MGRRVLWIAQHPPKVQERFDSVPPHYINIMNNFSEWLKSVDIEDRRRLYLPPEGFKGVRVGTFIKIHGLASCYHNGRSKTWEVKKINQNPDGEIKSFDVEWIGPFGSRKEWKTITPEQFDAGEWEVFA